MIPNITRASYFQSCYWLLLIYLAIVARLEVMSVFLLRTYQKREHTAMDDASLRSFHDKTSHPAQIHIEALDCYFSTIGRVRENENP